MSSKTKHTTMEDDTIPGAESLMDGDVFITEEERQEREAAERREKRRKRLQAIAADEPPLKRPAVSVTSTAAAPTRKPDQKEDNESNTDDVKVGYNMFSDSVSPVETTKDPASTQQGTIATQQNNNNDGQHHDWDDADGYYKAVIGETIRLQQNSNNTSSGSISVRVAGVMGKGVFSTVLKCTTVSNETALPLPTTMALKCIRHNETMAKAALQELEILLQLKGSPGIVPLLLPTSATTVLDHRGHFLLLFDFMQFNLRDVLQKFGRGVGVAIQGVRSYFGQLMAAATHLKKHSIIHADLKPDNILVSADFSVVQLADFGSAIYVSDAEHQEPTPYLVSRFYRPPEIIMGIPPTYASDLWSLAVTAAELFLGDVLFRGRSNNDMLRVCMQSLGPMPNRVIRQHFVQSNKFPIPRHFEVAEGTGYNFLEHTTDPVSGQPIVKIKPLSSTGGTASSLPSQIRKARSSSDSKTVVHRFSALLQQCLHLDASRRISLRDALQHEFFHDEQDETKQQQGK